MSDSVPVVSVVVVNFNGRALLPDCLASLRAQTYPRLEIILVDNASSDGSPEWVEASYPEVRVVRNDANLGFAGGSNVGIRAARGSVIATLNTDAVAESDWLERAVAALENRSNVGMVASRVVFAHAPDIVESAGIAVDRAGVAWDRLNGEPISSADLAADVFGPTGGAALYRRDMLDDVGLFDAAYFLYLEDVDLAWRGRLRGWECLYVPDARVRHRHSATAGADSPFKHRLLARNRVRLVAKNYPAPLLGLYLPAIIGYDVAVVAAVALPGVGPWALRRAIVQGRIEGLRDLPGALRARTTIQRSRRISAWQFRSLLAPLPSPIAVVRRRLRLRQITRSIPSPGA